MVGNQEVVVVRNGRSRRPVLVTPKDIENKKFRIAGFFKRGYDVDEVDNFLDDVAVTIDALGKQLVNVTNNGSLQDTQTLDPEIAKLNNVINKLNLQVKALRNKNRKAETRLKASASKVNDLEKELKDLKRKTRPSGRRVTSSTIKRSRVKSPFLEDDGK